MGNKQTEGPMEEDKEKNSGFSFMQEKIKEKPVYANPLVKKALRCILGGALFGGTALLIWALALPRINNRMEKNEIQEIQIPEETVDSGTDDKSEDESPVYITETVSMELKDYEKMYQQLMQIGNQVSKSLVDISAVKTDTDWFDEALTSHKSVAGLIIGDNGMELLILTEHEKVKDGDLKVRFYDHTEAAGTLKKYDSNTGLAVISVNLSDVDSSTRDVISYAELGSSKSLRSGQPVIVVGNPTGSSGSLLFGNLTSVTQTAELYDSSYNILTTDILKSSNGSGVVADWSGKIVGLLQEKTEVEGQDNTIQAYGISDVKDLIEHLSNNQDIVYMGIVGADVTTSISEQENIPIGVYVSEVSLDSPAITAGIQPGDIITEINGQAIVNLKDIVATLLKCSSGQTVDVRYKRADASGYQDLQASVTLKVLQ
ncbi:serine protease [Clostridiaceae bacterium AM27-36LB]|nr:serine protease [Clostridiales bacterium AM23-16LB]RHR44167.1 serine protease [Clostridiaceae bacterium AF18-31LB]RHT82144.1 serine protease [Clostridiaceae bacterium AM27-36LB]RHW03936.1 serine protease [Clostridiaceae bacterium OF09-1]